MELTIIRFARLDRGPLLAMADIRFGPIEVRRVRLLEKRGERLVKGPFLEHLDSDRLPLVLFGDLSAALVAALTARYETSEPLDRRPCQRCRALVTKERQPDGQWIECEADTGLPHAPRCLT